MRIRKEKTFLSFFNEVTGEYIRTGIMKDGKMTGKEPFMSSFPELLDVGIMGHCIHGKSGLCVKAGVECYQDGLHAEAANMSINDFRNIAKQCSGKTFQFALGGCGDPDQHENFEEILKICKENTIVPNFTTSGFGITDSIAELCREYCGAVAVSWYRSEYTFRAINMLVRHGIKTNIHYVLTKNTIAEAMDRVHDHSFPDGINAIVFLLHKPVGLGSEANVITADNREFQILLQQLIRGNPGYKIGFDSCTVPALINHAGKIDLDSLDTCEGARWSAYISADMKMMPCSFDNQEQRWAVDLRKYSIQEAWNSVPFQDFRRYFHDSCLNCKDRSLCMGGCPICPQIVLCDKEQRYERRKIT